MNSDQFNKQVYQARLIHFAKSAIMNQVITQLEKKNQNNQNSNGHNIEPEVIFEDETVASGSTRGKSSKISSRFSTFSNGTRNGSLLSSNDSVRSNLSSNQKSIYSTRTGASGLQSPDTGIGHDSNNSIAPLSPRFPPRPSHTYKMPMLHKIIDRSQRYPNNQKLDIFNPNNNFFRVMHGEHNRKDNFCASTPRKNSDNKNKQAVTSVKTNQNQSIIEDNNDSLRIIKNEISVMSNLSYTENDLVPVENLNLKPLPKIFPESQDGQISDNLENSDDDFTGSSIDYDDEGDDEDVFIQQTGNTNINTNIKTEVISPPSSHRSPSFNNNSCIIPLPAQINYAARNNTTPSKNNQSSCYPYFQKITKSLKKSNVTNNEICTRPIETYNSKAIYGDQHHRLINKHHFINRDVRLSSVERSPLSPVHIQGDRDKVPIIINNSNSNNSYSNSNFINSNSKRSNKYVRRILRIPGKMLHYVKNKVSNLHRMAKSVVRRGSDVFCGCVTFF